MAEWNPKAPLLFMLMLACLPCVSAANIVPLAAAASVCALMLFILVTMIVIAFIWPDLKRNWILRNGKVKRPKSFFRKNEEAKKILINGSVASRTPSWYNTPLPNKTADTASWVQGWHQEKPVYQNVYEEQDVTMELGDDDDKEFKIETYVVDNEVLDVGPYKDTALTTSAAPASGNVYSDPYIYTTGDRVTTTISKSTEANGGLVSSVYQTTEMIETAGDNPADEQQASHSVDSLVKL